MIIKKIDLQKNSQCFKWYCKQEENFNFGVSKNTNDSRESSSIYVVDYLINEGAHISIYDPMVKKNKIYNDLTLLWELQGNNKLRLKRDWKI